MVGSHTVHVRNLDDETYRLMWAMKKKLKARSWADLMQKICKSFEEEIGEFEWL